MEYSYDVHPSGIAVLVYSSSIFIVADILAEEKIIEIPYQTTPNTNVKISPDGSVCSIINFPDSMIDLFSISSGCKIRSIDINRIIKRNVIFGNNSNELLFRFITNNHIVLYKFKNIYNIEEEPVIVNLILPIEEYISQIIYNFDYTKFAICVSSKFLVWDLKLEKFVWNLNYSRSKWNADLSSKKEHTVFYNCHVYSAVFSPDDTKIAVTVGNDTSFGEQIVIKFYDTITGKFLMNVDSIDCFKIVVFSPDSSQFIIYETNIGCIDIFNVSDLDKLGAIKVVNMSYIIFDHTGNQFIAIVKDAFGDNETKIIDNPFRKPSGMLTKAATRRI